MAKILTTIMDGVEQSLREVSADTGLLLVKNGKFTKEAATEQMNGVGVHRYEGSTATNAMPGQEFQKMNTSGLKEVPWILWVDDKGLPQKYTVSILDKRLNPRQTRCQGRGGRHLQRMGCPGERSAAARQPGRHPRRVNPLEPRGGAVFGLCRLTAASSSE
jgi:hypothetical protein